MSGNDTHADTARVTTEVVQGLGGCGAISPDGEHACILALGHAGPHGWEEADTHADTIPSVEELRAVIVAYVQRLEPVATSDGVAREIYAYLVEREEAMPNETRLPHPGEYVDPQPTAVDVAGDEHVKRDDEIVREAITAAPIEVREAFERVFIRSSGQLTDAELGDGGSGGE